MKFKIKYSIVIALLSIGSLQQIYTQEMTKEKALFYYLTIFNLNPSDFVDTYAEEFDSYKFNQSKSDEFEATRYREKTKKEIVKGMKEVNFNDKFHTTGYGDLGKYSFTNKLFPIEWVTFNTAFSIGCCTGISVPDEGGVVNKNKFTWVLEMPDDLANGFIKRRKDNQGNINRRIYLKATYSLLNRKYLKTGYHNYLNAYFYSIEMYDDSNFTIKLGTIYPKADK